MFIYLHRLLVVVVCGVNAVLNVVDVFLVLELFRVFYWFFFDCWHGSDSRLDEVALCIEESSIVNDSVRELVFENILFQESANFL